MKNAGLAAASLLAGFLFGAGLAVSGMVNPEKILSFLDIAAIGSGWDATLLFVMGGALAVTFAGYRYVLAQPKPVLDETFHLPEAREPDFRLLVGAAIFGLGWGLVGYCPGPAIASLAWPQAEPALFVAAMIAGFWAGGRSIS